MGLAKLDPGAFLDRLVRFASVSLWVKEPDGQARESSPMAARAWAASRPTLAPLLPVQRAVPAVRQAELADARTLARAMGLESDESVASRFAAGRRGYVVEAGGEPVSYCWLSLAPEEIGELERRIRPAPDEVYVWDCATLPAYRGRGYYPAVLRHIADACFARGIRRVWICARTSNRASLRGFAKAGFRPVATLHYVRVLGWRHLAMQALPGISDELARAARAALGLGPARPAAGEEEKRRAA